jgi:hypothetical protein
MVKQITTIIARIDPECMAQVRNDFDKDVSVALSEGDWKLVSAGMTDLYLWAIVEGTPL